MTPALISTPKGEKRIQEIIGALLYYARAFHNKLLLALSAIGDQQAAATEDTSDTIKQILDYVLHIQMMVLFIAQATWFFHTTLT